MFEPGVLIIELNGPYPDRMIFWVHSVYDSFLDGSTKKSKTGYDFEEDLFSVLIQPTLKYKSQELYYPMFRDPRLTSCDRYILPYHFDNSNGLVLKTPGELILTRQLDT